MMNASRSPRPNKYYIERQRKELPRKIAALFAEFGEGPVKAAVNRRPNPQRVGRPQVRDYVRMFTLWVVVEASAKLANGIGPACQVVEELGGVYEYRPPLWESLSNCFLRIKDVANGIRISYPMFHSYAYNKTTIRRQYYQA